MNITTTSLETSKALHDAGVKTESCLHWYVGVGTSETKCVYVKERKNIVNIKEIYCAYTISDLPAVLRELEKMKGWGICLERFCNKGVNCMMYMMPTKKHWLRICELYATEGMSAVDKYLQGLLK